jgi:hypothetical protein
VRSYPLLCSAIAAAVPDVQAAAVIAVLRLRDCAASFVEGARLLLATPAYRA